MQLFRSLSYKSSCAHCTNTTTHASQVRVRSTFTLVAERAGVYDIANETKNHGSLTLDRDGVPQHTGNPQYGEECEQRAILGSTSCAPKESRLTQRGAMREVIRVVRKSREKVAPLQKQKNTRRLLSTRTTKTWRTYWRLHPEALGPLRQNWWT